MIAKPVIDILVAVEHLRHVSGGHREQLRLLGYSGGDAAHAAAFGRLFFRKGEHRVTHHLHIVPLASPDWNVSILFRDYLRTHPDAAAEYARLKADLAQAHAADRAAYTGAKSVFIRRTLAQAGDLGRA